MRYKSYGTPLEGCQGTSYEELVWGCVTTQVTWNLCEGVLRHTLRGTCVKVCHGIRYVELVWRCVTAQVTWKLCEGVSRHRLRGNCVKVCHQTDTPIGRFQSTRFFLLKMTFRRCISFCYHVKNENIESSFFAIPDTWSNLNRKFEILTVGVLEYANARRYAVLTGIYQSLVNEYERPKS